MSRCELVFFRPGQDAERVPFHNAWLGAPVVWYHLCERYDVESPILMPLENVRDLWAKEEAGVLALEYHERAVLYFTYDYALVERRHFDVMAHYLYDLVPHPRTGHLLRWSQALRARANDETISAVGLYGTSVSRDTWKVEEDGVLRDYDPERDVGHWYVDLSHGVPER